MVMMMMMKWQSFLTPATLDCSESQLCSQLHCLALNVQALVIRIRSLIFAVLFGQI